MYGLCRIIQIDSFIPNIRTVVDLDGHSIINGTNGAGKSSTLKLLSFFYGSDPSQLDSHAAGRDPFVQFYLPRQTSLLVFEYARESGLTCAVAYRHKSGTKHVYRFLEGGFSEERFSRRDSSGKAVYCKGHELKIHWRQLGLICSQQIEVVTDYRAIIQNDSSLINRLADSKALRHLAASYCLGSRKIHMRYIDRICAAIISRSGNMERMKDMLADIMVEDGVIFPKVPIHSADVGLAKEIRSLLEFEKEIPRMKSVLKRHYERLGIETKLGSYGGQVKQIEFNLGADIEQANQAFTHAQERLRELQLEWESNYSELNRKVIGAKNKVDLCEEKTKRLDHQYDSYEEQEMDQKVSDFENLGRFIESAEQAKSRYEKLNEEVREEADVLHRSLNAEHERFERNRATAQSKLDAVKENLQKRSQAYLSNREAVLVREGAEVDATREDALPDRELLTEAKAIAQAYVKAGAATEEEKLSLSVISQRIEELERIVDDKRTVFEENSSALEVARKRQISTNEVLGRAKSGLHTKQGERDALHKLAFAEDGTWLKQLREKNSNWVECLGKVINPDLLQRKDLHAEYTKEELDTVFGWSINLNAIAPPQYAETEDQLRAEYSTLEESVRNAGEAVLQCESDCRKANKQHKEAELAVNAVQISLRENSREKKSANKSYRARSDEIDAAVADRRMAAKKEVERLRNEISDFDKEQIQRINAVRERHAEELRELQGAWALEENRIEQEIERLSKSRKITSAIEENMKIDALSSMGISLTSRIDSLDYWKPLQDFSNSWQEWRESGGYGLPNQQFLNEMSLLIDALKSIKSGGHLRDYFDLHIQMVENGHERIIKNDHQLDNSTSDGLKYLALCVIFIAISRLLCPNKEVLLHWPIDELGILHGENVSRLFKMLNHGGIIMVGGFPSEDPVMLRHFKHRQVIDFKKGIRVIDIPKSTLRERALARRNMGVTDEYVS